MSQINLDKPESQNNNNNNNNNGNNSGNQNFGAPQTIPNSVGALVLGILSIVFCWCYGIIAIILGIIALVLANQGEKLYKANPQMYFLASYKNLKAGKICGIIGLSLGTVYIIALIIVFVVSGTFALNAFRGMY
jgi:hypothetical protein